MKKSILLACAILYAWLPGTTILAQTQTHVQFGVQVAAYNEVSADHGVLIFEIEPGTGILADEVYGSVAYATNSRTGRNLTVEVSGDLSDLELIVESLDVVVHDILGVGTPGVSTSLLFDAPGAQRLVSDIKQVDAERSVKYRLVAKTPEATGIRTLYVIYTITE